ncbi:MAG: hypothetical protein AUJ70_05305 [Candidatus Omnitrophica bacterium CG1_02_40_15]|nr:MAG: hypothetical protein AUJ70_05305 [Candidatus Omnitrophica bacterium CG1_02_40_15]
MKYNLKIIALAASSIFVVTASARAIDLGIDKAVSLNLYLFDNKELVSELKIDNLDIKGAILSGNFILKAKVLKDNGLTGKLYSSNMTINSSALPDLKVFFKLTKDKFEAYSLNFGNAYRLKGTVRLKKQFETNIYFEILRANLKDIAIMTKAKRPGVVTGVMNGLFNIKGPLNNLQSSGFISSRSGKIGPIWYDSADIRIQGIGPIINIVASRIKQAQATFTMEGYIDLRNVVGSDLLSYIKLKSDMKTIVWDGWDISKDGYDSLKMVKDIGDKVSVGFKTFAREELPPYKKRDNLDEMSLEYKLDNGQVFQMKLKENEEFFGIEHKKRF